MKDSHMEVFCNNSNLEIYKNDPEWFKLSLLRACAREYNEEIKHLEAVIECKNKQPIVTLLKYIRTIQPDSVCPIDEEIKSDFGDTCVILIPNEDGGYLEPISHFKVHVPEANERMAGLSVEEIYDYTVDNGIFLALYERKVLPFGYVTPEILQRWKRETVSHKEDLLNHLSALKKITDNNFGFSFIGSEEIFLALDDLKR